MTKVKNTGKCKAGAYCIGMDALLDAEVNNGIRVSLSMNVTTGKSRGVVVHQAKYEGKKVQMYLSYCPCCGAAINQPKKEKRK